MEKKLILPLLSVTTLTAVTQSGFGALESLHLEKVPGLFTIGLTVACLLLCTGLHALAPLNRNSSLRNRLSKLADHARAWFRAVSAAFIGWPLGLCVAELGQGHLASLSLGLLLTLITLLFLGAYVWVNGSVKATADYLSNSMFRPRRSIVAVRCMGLTLVIASGYIATTVIYPITADWIGA